MEFNQLHFAHPLWLLIGLVIPIMWFAFFVLFRKEPAESKLEKFADSHLLPYLCINKEKEKTSYIKNLVAWSLVWACLTIAIAGPRWNLRETEIFSKDQSLIVLLDLSESMNAADIKPSRLTRAKQKVEDFLNASKGVKIGLIAFAADAHMITPLTDDKETVRHLLKSLDTDLVHIQGSRLSAALKMAYDMLNAEPGNNKAILIISDGGGDDTNQAIQSAKKLAGQGVVIHVMGIGTEQGAPLQKGGRKFFSKLEKDKLKEISVYGNGKYFDAHYSDSVEATILKELQDLGTTQMDITKKHQSWDEGFYLVLIPALPIFIFWFRRGCFFVFIALFFLSPKDLNAFDAGSYFKNTSETAKEAYDNGFYDEAADAFDDPYRKGVALYKGEKFDEAEKMFRLSDREQVDASARYNLGNTLVQQEKYKEAIKAYEQVLKKWPDHIHAKENLELVKKFLEQQQDQDNSDSENSDKSDKKDKNNKGKNSKDKNKNKDNDQQDKSSEKENSKEDQEQNGNDQQEEKGSEQDKKEDVKPDQEDKSNDSEEDDHNQQNNESEIDNDSNEQEQKDQQQQADGESENENDNEKENPQEIEANADLSSCEEDEKNARSERDQEADAWLSRISNDPKAFLKSKFHIESKKNGTREGIDPW